MLWKVWTGAAAEHLHQTAAALWTEGIANAMVEPAFRSAQDQQAPPSLKRIRHTIGALELGLASAG